MTAEQEERDRLNAALTAFWRANQKLGLKSVRQWAIASKLSPSTINPVLKGTANKRLEDETYFKLALGASELLSRSVSMEELKGEQRREISDLSDEDMRDLMLLKSLKPKLREKYRDLLQAMASDADDRPDAEAEGS